MPRSRSKSSAGLALAALFAITQLSGFPHHLAVQHAICAEHGEAIHVGRRSDVASALSRELRAAGSLEHGHDHCLLAVHRREQLAHSTAPDLDVVLTPLVIAQPCWVESSVSGIEVLLLAPKSSPPA